MATEDEVVDLINKVTAIQGDIRRAIVWLSRMHNDLQDLMKQLIISRNGAKDES